MMETDSKVLKVISTISEMKNVSHSFRAKDLNIGFIPTMGCLHEGHLSLIKKSLENCDRTVVSIFVNPTQFGANEDLDSYPRQLQCDIKKLEEVGVDFLFHPSNEEMYPSGHKTCIQVREITKSLCGKSRPDLFDGVSTVVLKLFNIVHPNKAYFGEKDWQQLAVIEALVKDLNLDIVIVRVPIVREADGLAMSSRNCYLSTRERIIALSLSRALKQALDIIQQGTTSAKVISHSIRQCLLEKGNVEIIYITICDPKNFKEKEKICGRTLIALAVKIGKSRLIDNCIIEAF